MSESCYAKYESDPTPSREIAQRYRSAFGEEDTVISLSVIHYRGGQEEFDLGAEYCRSQDPLDRATGADILGQLGWAKATFIEASTEILIGLLDDDCEVVLYRSGVALGHRSAPTAIPALVGHMDHPNFKVRYGVVLGLSGQENLDAIEALIHLAKDENDLIRDWAVFGLGSQIDMDTPDIRSALKQALKDTDHEIRGEALVGLAKRGDGSVVDAILKEWSSADISVLSLEAAELIGDSRLYPSLMRMTQTLSLEDDHYFTDHLNAALQACTPVL